MAQEPVPDALQLWRALRYIRNETRLAVCIREFETVDSRKQDSGIDSKQPFDFLDTPARYDRDARLFRCARDSLDAGAYSLNRSRARSGGRNFGDRAVVVQAQQNAASSCNFRQHPAR